MTTGGAFPAVADLVPHASPMVLLARVLDHAPETTVCAVDVQPGAPFVEPDGGVPAWIGLEYLAQCVAVHAGLRARARGEPVRVGFLIGSRRVDLHAEGFRVGQRLVARVTHLWGERDAAAFRCRLEDEATGAVLVEGHLSVALPATIEPLRLAPR